MQRRGLVISLCLMSLCAFVMWRIGSSSFRPAPVRYPTTVGDSPVAIAIEFGPPIRDLAAVRETTISQDFHPGDLLSIGGALVLQPQEAPRPVLVELIEHRGGNQGDVVANSAVEIPQGDGKKFKMLINAPQKPGEYDLVVQWGGGKNYIARGKIVVRSK